MNPPIWSGELSKKILRGIFSFSSAISSRMTLIIPSRIESIPVVLSDAAQADCPVVVCDVGDMGKIVKRFGNGVVVQPEPDSIRKGLTQIWDAARNDFQPGCRRMAAEFSLARSAHKVIE